MLTNAVFLKLFKDYLPLVLNVLVLIRHPCVLIVSGIKRPCVNPTSLRADSQWIMILKTFELVTLSFSQFHAQRNWLLPHALHIFNQYVRLPCCFSSLMLFLRIYNLISSTATTPKYTLRGVLFSLIRDPKREWLECGSPKFFFAEPGVPSLRCLEP